MANIHWYAPNEHTRVMTEPAINISKHPAAIRVEKLPIPIKVQWITEDGICQTLEGEVAYQAGDPVLTGAEGEQWTMPKQQFLANYKSIAPTVAGADGYYYKKPLSVYALKLDQPMDVQVGHQKNLLHGEPGDWLLQYEPGKFGIVAALIFDKTYRILGD